MDPRCRGVQTSGQDRSQCTSSIASLGSGRIWSDQMIRNAPKNLSTPSPTRRHRKGRTLSLASANHLWCADFRARGSSVRATDQSDPCIHPEHFFTIPKIIFMAQLCGEPTGPDGVALTMEEKFPLHPEVKSLQRRVNVLAALVGVLAPAVIILIALVRPSRAAPNWSGTIAVCAASCTAYGTPLLAGGLAGQEHYEQQQQYAVNGSAGNRLNRILGPVASPAAALGPRRHPHSFCPVACLVRQRRSVD